MTGRETTSTKRSGLPWPALWVAGTAVLTAALPLTVADRLPDPVATHWGGAAWARTARCRSGPPAWCRR